MNIKDEIARVEKIIAITESPYLKKDYEKYLKKLLKKLNQRNYKRNRIQEDFYG